jgi:UDP-2-acetamido-2,6-beta-L-arabino-hexul-4-ose reductase
MSVSNERLNVIRDQRGLVLELLSAEDLVSQRNAHVVVSFPGVARGNHYHTKGSETITVLGPSLVRFREQGGIEEVFVPEKEARRFVFPPGVSHAMKNLGGEANILIAFNTLEHDPADSDTKRDLLI